MELARPRAYSYIRFSTPEQSKGASLARQTSLAEAYAKEHNLVLDDELSFKDLGLSAFKQENLAPGAELRRFIDLVRSGRVPRGSYLLIESLDRLTRADIYTAQTLLLDLVGQGVVIVTLTDGAVYERTGTSRDFSNLIIASTVLQRANEESELKRKRLLDKWERKRQSIGQRKLTKLCPAWMRLGEDDKYHLIPERVRVVRRIVDMTMLGIGKQKIAGLLNEEGILNIAPARASRGGLGAKANTDQTWHASYIRKIVSNRALIGEFQPHKLNAAKNGVREPIGAPVSNYFPAVLRPDEFDLLQATISGRGTNAGERPGRVP